jgi:HPt (histidine-containing phosphotransfer) domain-containing protein
LPVIAMTANTMVGDREKALAAGMNDHIAKPIKVNDMFATLARWVRPAVNTSAGSNGAANADEGADSLAALPGIDTRIGLAATMGNEVLYRRLLCMFRDGQADFLARFNAARAAGELTAATRVVHDLKSLAATLGIHAMQQEAAALERACTQGAEGIDALAQEVDRLLDPVIKGLQTLGPARKP